MHRPPTLADQGVEAVGFRAGRFPGLEKRRNEQMAREDWTFYQNPVDHAAVLIAVEVWKLLDRLGPHGDMQGRIKDFEELSDEERGGAVLKASVLVQAKRAVGLMMATLSCRSSREQPKGSRGKRHISGQPASRGETSSVPV